MNTAISRHKTTAAENSLFGSVTRLRRVLVYNPWRLTLN
jgi:hypothetical protein